MQDKINSQEPLALVLEGGGMRGARGAGFVSESGRMDFFQRFHRVYGVSSGAFTASLAVAGQFDVIDYIWQNLLYGKRFLSLTNPLTAKPIMDLDYLIQILKSGETMLDLSALRISNQELFFVATNYRTGDAEYFDAREVNVFDAMRASAALPFFYHKPIHINGDRYFDGCFSDPIPVGRAIADGFRKIVVVRSRPEEDISSANPLISWLQFPMAKQLREVADQKVQRYSLAFQALTSPPDGVKVYTIRPKDLNLTKVSTDKPLLIEAVEQGREDARKHIPKILKYFSS